MRSIIFAFLFFIVCNGIYADTNDMQKIMNNTINQQDALKSNAYNYLKNFSPKNHFDHYSDSPTETKYYSGVTQKGSGQLDQDAVVAKGNSYAGKTISQSIHSHPSFVINSSDSSITHSQVITDNAEEIVRGVTNRYVNCQSEQVCKTGYVKNVCEESPQEVFQSCRKTLNIDVIPHETDTHFPLKVHVSTRDHDYSGVVVNVVNGNISFVGPRDTTFKMDGRLPNGLDCHTLQGSITNFNTNNRNTKLDSIIYPSCSGMDLNFHLSGRGTINLDMQIDIVSKVITYEVKDRWVEDCDGLLQEPSCTFKSKVCTQPKETRIFQGMQVTRDCWQERYDYICHAGSGSGDCTTLQAQGCEQIDSTCKNQKNDQCLLYQQTYQCPIKSCSPSSNINCGDGSNYCLDGNCIDHQYQPSKDFAKGVSSLSAVADASKQFDPSTMSIFSGHPVECSEKPVGFSNCCTETGWGKDVGLANCSMQEKKLHEDRDKGVSIKIGRYCSGSDPFPCLEHSQVFCVFNSKLARIVQDQGRKGQLNIGFGSGKNPNCSGLTPAQLQSIDLSRIDFQDFYADIHAKAPDINQIQQMLSNHIKEFQEAGQVNG